MPRTTQCPNCGVGLNLPGDVAGKRLRCPKCSHRFTAEGPAGPPPDSKAMPTQTPGPASSLLLTTRQSEPDLPTAPGDLRETFDASLLMGEADPPPGPSSKSREASAAGLFDEPRRPRGPSTLAEARSKPRRCPTCSAVVPAGMSLCSRCGLDLDTGQRHHLEEIFEAPAPARRRSSTPLVILVIGGLTLIVSLILTLLAIVGTQDPAAPMWGSALMAIVGAFGIYASIQFLRVRSFRLLITALLLGAVLDIGLLIVMPIVRANTGPRPVETTAGFVVPGVDEMPQIEGVAQRLQAQMWKINWGIGLLLVDVGLLIYLLTGRTKRYFDARRHFATAPIP